MQDGDRVAREIGRRLRALRSAKGLTLRALAQEADISEALLSRIERGQVATTVANLVTRAARLGVGLGEIFAGAETAEPAPRYALTRAGEVERLPATSAHGYEYRPLNAGLKAAPLNALLVSYLGANSEAWLTHPGYELLYVLSGRLRFRIADEELLLGAGDCLIFDSRQPHSAESLGGRAARTLMVLARDAAAGNEPVVLHPALAKVPATPPTQRRRRPVAPRAK